MNTINIIIVALWFLLIVFAIYTNRPNGKLDRMRELNEWGDRLIETGSNPKLKENPEQYEAWTTEILKWKAETKEFRETVKEEKL